MQELWSIVCDQSLMSIDSGIRNGSVGNYGAILN